MRTRAGEAPVVTPRLLVITYSFPPDGYVGGLRWGGITKYLARLGWKIAVVTAARPKQADAAIGVQVEWCPRLWTLGDGYRIVRLLTARRSLKPPLPKGSRDAPAPGRLLRRVGAEIAAALAFPDEGRGWMLRAAFRARSVIQRFGPQVVVSSGPPHSAHVVAAMATIGTGVRWLIDLRDPWAGPLPEIWRSHRRLGTRVFRTLTPRLERLTFRAADGVIANTSQLAAALAARYPEVRVLRIPNGVDPESLPAPAGHRYPGLGVAYAGRLYTGRDLGPVVSALRILFERHPEAAEAGSKLRVAGEADPDHARVFREAVAVAGMERHVEVLGSLPRAQALDLVSRSRLAVVLAQDQELQVPAKLYESVAMGIPTLVVAPVNSAAGIEGARVGAVVRDSADVEGIACVLAQLWRGDWQPSCPVPITYEATAAVVDELFSAVALLGRPV